MKTKPTEQGGGPVTERIACRVGSTRNLSETKQNGRPVFKGGKGFQMILLPDGAEVWNLSEVSVLGLMIKNRGPGELVLDLMLQNDGATGWSNSALGRTIVEPGEEIPLGIALYRSTDYGTTHPAYLRMSGRPDGTFRHWHTFNPEQAKKLVITCASEGPHEFELGSLFPLQKMNPSLTDVFPFIDRYGQYMLRDRPGTVHSDADLKNGIAAEKKLEAELKKPSGFTRYGGWADGPQLEATGFFRTQKINGRWWFVDPEGRLFWSYGVDCVGLSYAGQTPTERDPAVFEDLPPKDDPVFGRFHIGIDVEDNYMLREDAPHYDFTCANLYRKYGGGWMEQSVERDAERLMYCGFNTIGAWSDDAVMALRKVPYTAVIHYEYPFAADKLPDPFSRQTRMNLRREIEQYPVAFKEDPWCLGVFVNNELHWKNSTTEMVQTVFSYPEENTEVKKAFRDWLKKKYQTVEAFNAAWGCSLAGWDNLLGAVPQETLSGADAADCSALTTLLAEAFYRMVDEELARWSSHTLYLGSRMNVGCDEVVAAASKYADVISANMYSYHPEPGRWGACGKPVLISEFHFANVDGNNLGGGLRSAQDAVQQARLYKEFIARAVEDPKIIGAHWFQWRDQNVGGRYDGENYDIGFFDVADIPNEPLIRAAAEAGQNLYNTIE